MNNRWDEALKDKLHDFTPDNTKPAWDVFVSKLATDEVILQPEESSIQQSLDHYSANEPVSGWDRIESSLNESEKLFDDAIRDRVRQFHQSEANAWHNFSTFWSYKRHLRQNLIALKCIESSFLLLLLFAFYNLSEFGKPEIELPDYYYEIVNSDSDSQSSTDKVIALHEDQGNTKSLADQSDFESGSIEVNNNTAQNSTSTDTPVSQKRNNRDLSASNRHNAKGKTKNNRKSLAFMENSMQEIRFDRTLLDNSTLSHKTNTPSSSANSNQKEIESAFNSKSRIQFSNMNTLPVEVSPIEILSSSQIGSIKPNKRGKLQTVFGIITQGDYTGLRIAENKVYTFGDAIVFPSKRLYTAGFGGGFTLSLVRNNIAFETGMIYSSKSFRPGREVVIGSSSDNSSVEFQTMDMQVLTLPVMARFAIGAKKRLNPYLITGMAMNVVAKLDMDVVSNYHFASLAVGEDPSSKPHLLQTIQESKRLREGILDGEPFSSKNYLTANIGAGLEYALINHRSLFIQSIFQYQIPNLNFSNNKGKDLRSIAIQAGVRTTLGY